MSHYTYGAVKVEVAAIIDDLLTETADEKPEGLIAAREDVIAAAKELRLCADELERRTLERWPDGRWDSQVRVTGVGTYVRGRKNNQTTWNDRGAGFAIAAAGLANDLVQHPNDVVSLILEAAAIGYWRLTALRAAGIDPDNYRTVVPGLPCIHLAV